MVLVRAVRPAVVRDNRSTIGSGIRRAICRMVSSTPKA
jgi:hypothetical protein